MIEIEVQEFVSRLRYLLEKGDSKYSFFLGAGCSVSSGIPTAATLVKQWLRKLKWHTTRSEEGLEHWVAKTFTNYDPANPAGLYPEVMERLFPSPEERQQEIEKVVEGKDPGFGYAVLAQLVTHDKCGRHCNVVLTTNFDDLVADALYLYSNRKPLVIVHESLFGFVMIGRTRPLVIKLHGDARIQPKNIRKETRDFDEAVEKVLTKLLSETGLIFVGYGGNDKNIISILRQLPEDKPPWGVYWIRDTLPRKEFSDWLELRNAIWVRHLDFDELMLLVRNEFDLDHPDKRRFDRLVDTYFDTFVRLKGEVEAKPASTQRTILSSAIIRAASDFKDWRALVLKAKKYEQTDPEKADRIYLEGLEKFPANPTLLGNYAVFLDAIVKDYDKAERYYKMAIEAKPDAPVYVGYYAILLTNIRKDYDKAGQYLKRLVELLPKEAVALTSYADFLTVFRNDYDEAEQYYVRAVEADPNLPYGLASYANFLSKIRKNYDKAEIYYKRAIEADPNSAAPLSDYAVFLTEVRKDHDRSEDFHKKAIETDPNHANNLSNYANFLKNVRKEHDRAEEFYKRAIEIDPNQAQILGNYANFLTYVRKDHVRAEEFYKRAIEADPNQAQVLGNYAVFLTVVSKDHDGAEEFYKKAIDADPSNAHFLGSYGNFLTDVRKDHDRAEEFYKRAIEIDPNETDILGDYANFLTYVRKGHDRAEEFYKRAIEIDPNQAQILGNYAIFVKAVRKDHDRAEHFFKKAIDTDPSNAHNLGNYAIFLKDVRKDDYRAEQFYKKAIEADPNHANNLSNYAGFLLARARQEEGHPLLAKAIALAEGNTTVLLECHFYQYAHIGDEAAVRSSLVKIKELIEAGVRSPGWNLEDNVRGAIEDGHPHPEFLKTLAKVISDEVDAKELDKFDEWKEAS